MQFRSTMKNSKNTFLAKNYVDSVPALTIKRVNDDFDSLIDSILTKLDDRHKLVKEMISKSAPATRKMF
jgi:hypothetical protein